MASEQLFFGNGIDFALKKPFTAEEVFVYLLPGSCLLEEFHASLTPCPPYSGGLHLNLSLHLQLAGLFHTPSQQPQYFFQSETLSYRLPWSDFSEPLLPPFGETVHWQVVLLSFAYFPDLSGQRLELRILFSLRVYALREQIFSLPEPSSCTFAEQLTELKAEMQVLRREISACREEIRALKYRLQHP